MTTPCGKNTITHVVSLLIYYAILSKQKSVFFINDPATDPMVIFLGLSRFIFSKTLNINSPVSKVVVLQHFLMLVSM